MIVHSNIGGYRFVLWKEGYNCYFCFRSNLFKINHRYEWRLKTEITRREAIRRIQHHMWNILQVGCYTTHIMQTSATGSILIPHNFDHYQQTYYQMIKLRNFHNQIDRIFWELSIHDLCPTIYHQLIQLWFSNRLHRRRMKHLRQELELLPPSSSGLFPGGIIYQSSLSSFISSLHDDNDTD